MENITTNQASTHSPKPSTPRTSRAASNQKFSTHDTTMQTLKTPANATTTTSTNVLVPLSGNTPMTKKKSAQKASTSASLPPPSHPTRKHVNGKWSKTEDDALRAVVQKLGGKNWKRISELAFSGSRTDVQCLHRWQKVLRPGLHKGPWSKDEDSTVLLMVKKYGGVDAVKWSVIAAELPGRLGKQVRERWYNHLDPTLNKSAWTVEEDKKLAQLQKSERMVLTH